MFDLNTLGPNSIRDAVDRLNRELLGGGGLLCGRRVVELPTHRSPKLKLSPDCPVSDEFRAEMDAWLVEQFGYRDASIFQPGRAYLFGDTVAVHPADWAKLRGVI
jgi:hypothetical protein